MKESALKVHKTTQVVGDVEVSTSIVVPTHEHDKLAAVRNESQAIGLFLDSQHWSLCLPHEHTKHCRDKDKSIACGYSQGEYVPVRKSITTILAEYFEIDERKLENEKLALLEAIRR